MTSAKFSDFWTPSLPLSADVICTSPLVPSSLSFCTMRVLSLARSLDRSGGNKRPDLCSVSIRPRRASATDEVCQRLCGMCSVNFLAPHSLLLSKEFGAGHSVKWERSVSPLRAKSVRNLSPSSCALIRCCRSLETGAKCERTMIIKGEETAEIRCGDKRLLSRFPLRSSK